MQYHTENLVVRASTVNASGSLVRVTPEDAGWDFIHFEVKRLEKGDTWEFKGGAFEAGVIVLSGTVNVHSDAGNWEGIGSRDSVFDGLPEALYLPIHTSFKIEAATTCEVALAWVPAEKAFPARLVKQADVNVEIRGGDNATRQINDIFPPGFPCQRLVVVEVYTPSGGWSSYPPHKHDVHKEDADGKVVEADLEEVYFYKIDRPEGYAYQRIYTDPESPLHQAGYPIDSVVIARDNDAVLVPEGYHPVVSPPGYVTYYLNILAGSAQSLANSDDPQFAWVKDTYSSRNQDIPVYPI